MPTRRDSLVASAALLAGAVLPRRAEGAEPGAAPPAEPAPPASASFVPSGERLPYRPVITPNGAAIPWKRVNGVKVFHLIAEEVMHEFAPGLKAHCWGYNGRVHGPTFEAVEGDNVRIYVTNKLAAPTSVHWHGLLLPNGMDGVAGLTQPAIKPGETFKYEFPLVQHGTLMYHSHHDEMTQMALGMMGLFVIHPRRPLMKIDRDFAIMLSEWRIDPGTSRPDPMEMVDFNILSMNAKVFPATAPLVCRTGDRVRIRLGNLSAMDHHPIHIHGHAFRVVATDGGDTPSSAQRPETSVLVPVGSTRDVYFVADRPGDWALHCHMTHHVMNQMGHGIPNVIGVPAGPLDARIQPLLPKYMSMGEAGMGGMAEMGMAVPENSIPMVGGNGPFGEITMGGMFTNVKIRNDAVGDADPGWYKHPTGEVAGLASADELRRDGIVPG